MPINITKCYTGSKKRYINSMAHYDLYITSIPDHKAKLLVARSLANNPSIPLHVAMDLAGKPPLLLYKDIESKEAEQHIKQFKKFGITFKAVPSKTDSPDETPPIIQKEQGKAPLNRPAEMADKQKTVPTTPPDINKQPPRLTQTRRKENDHRFRSGIMVGDQIEPKKEKHTVKVIIIIGMLAILGSLLFTLPQKKIQLKRTDSSFRVSKQSSGKAQSAASSEKAERRHESVSRKERQRSEAYLDSTLRYPNDYQRKINFYKIAISFNKYNLEAWQGLLRAYGELGMSKEAAETRKKMERIFGEEIHSVKSAVERYGSLDQAYLTEEGVYRIKYNSRSRSRDEFLRETFLLTRAVRNSCRCKKISIHASAGAGRGMLVHSGPDVSVHSLSEFSSQASITWLE